MAAMDSMDTTPALPPPAPPRSQASLARLNVEVAALRDIEARTAEIRVAPASASTSGRSRGRGAAAGATRQATTQPASTRSMPAGAAPASTSSRGHGLVVTKLALNQQPHEYFSKKQLNLSLPILICNFQSNQPILTILSVILILTYFIPNYLYVPIFIYLFINFICIILQIILLNIN